MIEKSKIKIGETVRIIAGKYRNSVSVVKKIDKKRKILFLENMGRTMFVMNKRIGKREPKEVFIPIHISNIELTEK